MVRGLWFVGRRAYLLAEFIPRVLKCGKVQKKTARNAPKKVEDNGVMVTLETLQGKKRTEIVLLGEKYGARNIRVFGSVA
ncbi:MAG TPA: hypothetical protein VGX70_08095, partial [Gemmataceae bacterium]|nr:hypothetical protein [Gemmataceae bacterium]